MQEEILAKNAASRLRVYAVWLPMLPGAARSQWRASALPDPRVSHFWDDKRVAGRWFGEQVEGHRGIVWDAYYLYGARAQWARIPAPLISSGTPVIGRRNELQRSLLAELRAP